MLIFLNCDNMSKLSLKLKRDPTSFTSPSIHGNQGNFKRNLAHLLIVDYN